MQDIENPYIDVSLTGNNNFCLFELLSKDRFRSIKISEFIPCASTVNNVGGGF
jgi:hypothetical protein